MKDKYLSIAIPTRNDDCSLLVSKLLEQARRETSLDFEILIADYASDDTEVIRQLNSRVLQVDSHFCHNT